MYHLLLCLLILMPLPLLAAETRRVTPREDTEVVLSNPDMGWVLYENYPVDTREDGTSESFGARHLYRTQLHLKKRGQRDINAIKIIAS